MLRLHPLSEEVALRVHHRLRLARRPAGERDQARVLGASSTARPAPQRTASRRESAAPRCSLRRRSLRQRRGVALVGDHQRGSAVCRRRRRSFARSCSVHGNTTAPRRKHAQHAQHPLRAVADQRHHHLAASHPARRQGAREPRAALGDLPEAPLASRAVARELHQAAERSAAKSRGRESKFTASVIDVRGRQLSFWGPRRACACVRTRAAGSLAGTRSHAAPLSSRRAPVSSVSRRSTTSWSVADDGRRSPRRTRR